MKEIVVREDIERMNFEAWCKTRNDADRLNTSVDDDGDVYYEDVSIDYAWQGWIARAYKLEKEKQQKDGIKHAVLKAAESSGKSPEDLAESLIKAFEIIENNLSIQLTN
ncbi:hypothetical protein [Neisseria cinerea]|uniref:hypothetical protein n=1 Tax=Neisseria cinerea TaxID=483 RepID=UPI000C32A83A|nr:MULTISPECIES: hypothetical protein [Neisseria]DAK40019.1 MAG TPA: hypothetical protein [Bacteriophage sp.]